MNPPTLAERFRPSPELCYGRAETTRHFRMCMFLHGRASRAWLQRLVISGGILAGVGPLSAGTAEAQACADSNADLALVSVERLLEIADCERDGGNLQRAQELLAAAAERESNGRTTTLAIQSRLGRLSLARGDYPVAVEQLSLALEAAPESLAPGDAAALLNDLGGAYAANDEPLLGFGAFADSARVAPPASAIGATAAVNALRALHESGSTVDAASLERLLESVHALPAASRTPLLLDIVELRRELALPAVAPPRSSLELATEALGLAAAAGDAALLAAAHGELGAEHAAAADYTRALEHTRSAALIARDAGFGDLEYRFDWQLGRVLRQAGKQADALLAYEAAIATLDRTSVAAATSRRGFRRNVLPLYEEYADLALAATRGGSAAGATAALAALQRNIEKLRVAEIRNYFENQCSVPVVFDRAPSFDRTVVIYPMSFDDRLELLVSSGTEIVQVTIPVAEAELASTVRSLRDAIESSDGSTTYLAHARQLHAWLIEPLRELLERADADTLVFVPDGPLRTVPLGVLHDGNRFLVEDYVVATTPGLSLVGTLGVEPVSRVLVNGIVEPTQGFAGLPFVAEELRSIESTFPSRVYSDDAFVTATLEREILAGGYSVVHMATHAQFEADYRRSFLLAHDDLITMDRLEDVIGSQRHTDRPVDLLVLSACQTAAGDERAALGLAGVAVKAGARSALASLWFVNDESTARLIAEFYRQLGNGTGKAAALRGAQLLLLNDERYAHPAHWAPFLMIGDWR
jgi:CHAT domain-containing protein